MQRLDKRVLPAAMLLLALWVLTHPWEGLWHDGRLYAVQALHRLAPQQFQGDLFFLHGSQDAFTIFSPLYAAAIDALGLAAAALLLQVLGSLLWLGGAGFLLAFFLRGLAFWLGLALVVALPADYGPLPAMFNIGEAFPTPRLFAEALGMLAMGCALRARWGAALAAWLASALLHPLMAAGVALFGLLYLAEGRRRKPLALLLALGAALLAGAALAGIAPFDRVLRPMDQAWFAQVLAMTPVVTWDGWRWGEWLGRTVMAFSLVLAAAWLAEGARARFFCCVALAGGLGLLATWIGTGLVHNQLLMQLQPWRALWLLQLASSLALACLWQACWPRGRLWRALLLALCVGLLMRNNFGALLGVPAALMLCLQARRAQPLELSASHYRLALAMLAVLAFALVREIQAGPAWTGIFLYDIPLATMQNLWLFLWLKRGAAALLGVALLALAWRLGGSARPGGYLAACALAMAGLAGSIAYSRSSDAAVRRVPPATEASVRQAFLPLIPAQAVVYWQNDVRNTWFLLRRASYASYSQMAGIVFNRGTAFEGQRRMARLERMGMSDGVRKRTRLDTNLYAATQLPAPSYASVTLGCADPALDFIVLGRNVGGEVAVADSPDYRFYLHDCARVRAAARPAERP